MYCERVHTLAADVMRPLATIVSAAVVISSLVPSRTVPTFLPDYVLHSAGYSGVAFVWLLAVVWCPGQDDRASVRARRLGASAVVAAVVAMGTVVELVQQFVGRTTDPRDLIANLAGVGIGWTVWNLLTGICHRTASSRRATNSSSVGAAE